MKILVWKPGLRGFALLTAISVVIKSGVTVKDVSEDPLTITIPDGTDEDIEALLNKGFAVEKI